MTNKPNRNQKTISEEERDKIKQGAKAKKEKDAQDKLTISNAEKVLFEKEKQNLPLVLENQMKQIELALETQLQDYVGLKSARIHQLISRQTYSSGNAMIGYSSKELYVVFDAYKKMVDKINEYTLFVPSLKNFCTFAGISSNTFKHYLQSTEDEKRNIAQMIDDYITDVAMDSAKMRRTDSLMTKFEMQSVHQMVEANAPITIQHQNTVDINKIQDRINQIRKGNIVEGEFIEKD